MYTGAAVAAAVLAAALALQLMYSGRGDVTATNVWGRRPTHAKDAIVSTYGPLLGVDGRLSASGWARTHKLQYTREIALNAGAARVPGVDEYAQADRGLPLSALPPQPMSKGPPHPELPPHDFFVHAARYPPEEAMSWGPAGPPKKWSTALSQLPRRLRLKEWETWAVIGPHFMLVASIIDLGYSRTANIYLASTTGEDACVEEVDNAEFPFGVG